MESNNVTPAQIVAQMSRGASVMNNWDVVLNMQEDLANQIFLAQFNLYAKPTWKTIALGYCQVFKSGNQSIATYTAINMVLATPKLKFLSNNQAFAQVTFTISGESKTAGKVVSADYNPKTDCNLNDPSLDWDVKKMPSTTLVCKVPITAINGTPTQEGKRTNFVLDFPAGSFNSPLFTNIKDQNELQLQLKTYLANNNVQYILSGISTDIVNQIPQMAPKSFKLNVLTTNSGNNVFQIFIATENPEPANTTIGINEPIPDGYSISVLFNAKIVNQLTTTLMVQAWAFIQGNLIFPGSTNLSLGPEFTPEDALVLGKLTINTTQINIIPNNPKNDKVMLNIQKTKQISISGQPSFTIYGDDANPNAWYIVPKVVWAKAPGSNLPQFSLVKYNSNAGEISGYCRFSVELMIDPAQQNAVKAQIPNAEFPQFDWINAGAVFTYTIDGVSTSIGQSPSNFGGQQVLFSVPLENQKAIAAFKNAFSPSGSGGGTFGVSYNLAANTRLPAVTVVTKFDSTIAYTYQKSAVYKPVVVHSKDTWGHTHSKTVQVYVGTFVKEMLKQSQAGSVDVTPGKGITTELLDQVKTWAQQQLAADVQQAITTAMNLIKNPSNNFSMQNVSSFTNTLKTTNVVPWYFDVNDTLEPFSKETWDSVYSEVNQQSLEVAFKIQESLSDNKVSKVNLSFKYGGAAPVVHTFTNSDQSPFVVKRPGEFNNGKFVADYEYKYDVIYDEDPNGNTPPPLSTEWITSNETIVNFGLVSLGLMAVTFEASNIEWEQVSKSSTAPTVKEIMVDWYWLTENGGAVLNKTLILKKSNPSQTSMLRSLKPTNNQVYQYSLTFLMSDGTKLHANGLNGTSPMQRIDHPLSEVSVSVWPIFPDDANGVLLRATFDDEKNNIHLNNQWMARRGSDNKLDINSFETWNFNAIVENLNMTTIVFSGTWLDSENKQHKIPKTLIVGSNNTLMVSNTQKQVTAVVDASNVDFVAPKTNGVYRVVARVGYGTVTDPNTDPANGAQDFGFTKETPPIHYFTTDSVEIDADVNFHYQYIYTTVLDNGAHSQEQKNWSKMQTTPSTQLPVVPGTPNTDTEATVKKAMPIATKTRIPVARLDARTQALFAKHDKDFDDYQVEKFIKSFK